MAVPAQRKTPQIFAGRSVWCVEGLFEQSNQILRIREIRIFTLPADMPVSVEVDSLVGYPPIPYFGRGRVLGGRIVL